MIETDASHHAKECTASDMLVECLNTYSTDIVITKYPHPLDGLKKIHRRILYCLGTQTDKDAMTALIGDASKLHQGGDSSIYSAIIRMSQPFSVGIPLIYCHGNYGNYPKPNSAGHARYLELASSEFTRDVFFNGVHKKSIPMTYSKDFRRMEPLYFIPKVPMALYLNNLTIGYGFKSSTPQLNFGAVCDIVMQYAENYGYTPSIDKLARHMIPDFPSHQYLTNHQELLDAYRSGNYEHHILLSGDIELGPRTLKIRTLPFGVIPNTVSTNVIERLQRDKNFWLHNALRDINNYGGDDNYWEFVIELKNSTDIWEHLEGIKKLFHIDETIYPVYHFGYNDKIVHLCPTNLVELWYNHRYKSITAGIKSKQTELQLELLKLTAYLVVSDNTDKVIDICKTSDNEDEIVRRLSTEFEELTRMQSRVLANARLTTLAKQSKEKLLVDIEKTEAELTEVSSTYGTIHETIYDDAQFLKKKYTLSRKTIPLTHMAGFIHVNNKGIVQYATPDELLDLLQKFRHSDVKIYHENKYFQHVFSFVDNRQLPYNTKARPKEYLATHVIRSPTKNPYMGVFIEDGLAITNFIRFTPENYHMVPVARDFYGVTTLGIMEKTNITQHSRRKTVSKGAMTEYFTLIPDSCNNAVVLYMNTANKNELRMSRILYDNNVGKLSTIPTGDTIILDIVPYDSTDIFCSLDTKCVDHMAYRHLLIPNVGSLFKDNKTLVVLDLNKRNKGYRIRKHTGCSLVRILTSY